MNFKKLLSQILGILSLFIGIHANALEWETPVEVSQGVGQPNTPATIVVDPNNNAAVIWVQAAEVYTSYRPFSGSWETPTLHGKGREPQICMDDSGNTTIAYIVDGDNIVAKFRPSGGAWGATDILATSANTNDYSHLSLTCIDTNFLGYAAWNDANGGTPRLQTVHRRLAGSGTGASGWNTGTLNEIILGAQTADSDSRPLVKVLSDGTGVAAVRLLNGSTPDIYRSITVIPGGVWTSAANFGFQGTAGSDPNTDYVFDLRPNGNGILACSTASNEIWATTTTNGTAWLTPADVSQAATTHTSPQIAVDDAGIVQVIWVSIDGPNDLIAYKFSTAATNTWPPTGTSLNLLPNNNARNPVISTSPNGFTVAAWIEDPNATFISRSIIGGAINADGPFTIDTNIEDTSFMTGTVAASDSARGFAAWIDNGALNGFVESTGTNLPDDPVIASGDLLKALSKKRLIYQKGLYP